MVTQANNNLNVLKTVWFVQICRHFEKIVKTPNNTNKGYL